MNRTIAILLILASLVVGGIIGYVGGRRAAQQVVTAPSPSPRAEAVTDLFRSAARDAAAKKAACLREKLGAERYAIIALNPNAATAEDQLKGLPCQNQ